MFDRTEFKVSNLVQKVVIRLVMRKRVFLRLTRREVFLMSTVRCTVNHRGNHSGTQQNLPKLRQVVPRNPPGHWYCLRLTFGSPPKTLRVITRTHLNYMPTPFPKSAFVFSL